ncbi:MAG: hypothetical protein IJP22_04385 [Clostridia bacterium]|nr:hypothetical protein [Clostridia bacterium]
MKQYNKPEVMLFDCANESIAAIIDINSSDISTPGENGAFVPKVEDIW